jgi:hypothetical protein
MNAILRWKKVSMDLLAQERVAFFGAPAPADSGEFREILPLGLEEQTHITSPSKDVGKDVDVEACVDVEMEQPTRDVDVEVPALKLFYPFIFAPP